jgi:glycosyltransferase involved in cell wall biosynthesis
MSFVLGVEASRLAHDVRGIGRYVRAMLPRFLRDRPELRIVFFVKRPGDVQKLRRALAHMDPSGARIVVRHHRDMTRSNVDVMWYPWNISRPVPAHGAVVVSMHDVAPLAWPDPRPWKWWKNYRWRRLYRTTARRATLFITISDFSAREINRLLGVPRERIRVTLLAADDVAVAPPGHDDEALARLKVREPFVLTVGAADRRKNIGFLERAMSTVVKTHSEVTLALAGPRRKDRAAPVDPPWQRTLGFVSDDDLVTLYRRATALVAPTSYEGFGLPVLEAMRLGTPVICARASSLPEVAGAAALWVEPQDELQLAEAISRVLGDEALRGSMRQAGLQQATRFSWDETARLTIEAFEEAARAVPRGSQWRGAAV